MRRVTRGRVILWDDTFVRYHEPQVGIAAVKLLEAAGYKIDRPVGRECCGRPAFSQGNLDEVMRLGRHNLALLRTGDNAPILFLEPSCYSMFAEDYLELNLPGAWEMAARCHLLGEFLDDLLKREPTALRFNSDEENVVIHGHCHAKALMSTAHMHRLAMRLPNRKVSYLDVGCCGMAGGFGMLESKFNLSLEIAKPLMEKLRAQPYGTVIIASGTSCRQQIQFLAPVRARHIAEVLAGALA
jgi:Fe-S oxidoreductase